MNKVSKKVLYMLVKSNFLKNNELVSCLNNIQFDLFKFIVILNLDRSNHLISLINSFYYFRCLFSRSGSRKYTTLTYKLYLFVCFISILFENILSVMLFVINMIIFDKLWLQFAKSFNQNVLYHFRQSNRLSFVDW
jgi:hypothetical protein